MERNTRIILISLALLAVGSLIGWGISEFHEAVYPDSLSSSSVQVRADLPQYKFINPPLYSENVSDDSQLFTSFKSSLNSYINSAKKSGEADAVSVYFRDLNSARWTGVNEDDIYRPSSMLKIINMMAALQIAEGNSGFLSKQLYYEATDHSDQYFKPAHTLTTGYHTVQELINAMIIDSDNDALDALQSDPDMQNGFNSLYSLFRLPAASTSTPDFMSPKSYAVLFRTLYNSSLFPWSLSEQILDLLSRTDFTQGLVAGVPQGIVVAHKFGENTGLSPDGAVVSRELHDCGIVYYPGHPYLLCVMTRGGDFQALEKVISDISSQTYAFVDKQLKDSSN